MRLFKLDRLRYQIRTSMPARVDQRGLLRSETVRSGVFLISADVGSGGRVFDAFCQEALAADVSSAKARGAPS